MPPADVREYAVSARTTDTFGRVLCSSRTNHFVIDGPAPNGCPGEALTPPEAFLAGVAACGAELVQVLARADGVALAAARVAVSGVIDRARPVHPDRTVFNAVRIEFALEGPSDEQARRLVDGFRRR